MMPFESMGNLQAMVAAICQTAPESVPGSRVRYSISPGHAVMAEMVRRVDGGSRAFRDILRDELFEPLGMKTTALGLPDALRGRLAPVVVRDRAPGLLNPDMLESMNHALKPDTEVPAGGFVTTIADFARFAEMLRNGGELNGARILSPAMIDAATRNYTGTMPNDIWDYAVDARGWPVFPAYLGLGFFLRGEGYHPTPFGTLASARTFGGVGAGSTVFFVDPVERIEFCVPVDRADGRVALDRTPSAPRGFRSRSARRLTGDRHDTDIAGSTRHRCGVVSRRAVRRDDHVRLRRRRDQDRTADRATVIGVCPAPIRSTTRGS